MQFDPVDSAQSIPDMIKNDTLIEVLDQDQLSECLKHVTLNVDDSLYILDRVQSKYNLPDRFESVRHLFTDFGEGNQFDSKKFVEFIKSLGRCLHLQVLDSIAAIVESAFSQINQISTQSQGVNKNIEELKKIQKTEDNFDKIYQICKRIAADNDKEAMSFAVSEGFVYVTKKDGLHNNILHQAVVYNKQNMVRLLIESGIDTSIKDKHKATVLMKASLKGYTELVKFLLTVPRIDADPLFNSKALICACANGHHEVVKLLLAVPGIYINAKNNNNETAMMLASKYHHDEVAELLKAHGAI